MFIKNKKIRIFLKKILYYLVIIILVLAIFKIACYFMPFLIALIIANLIEPIIKRLSDKTGIVRKKSAIIVLVAFFGFIIALFVGITYMIVSEASSLLLNFSGVGNIAFLKIEKLSQLLNIERLNVPFEVKKIIVDTSNGVIEQVLAYLKIFLSNIINLLLKIPSFIIYLIITILATYFICTNRIALLDELEQHIPQKIIRKFNNHFKNTLNNLVQYVKAQLILIFISFILVLIGLYVFRFFGMKVESPFLVALGIGFVDLLPILGSGTVMVPWGIFEIIEGEFVLGFSILGLLIFISIVRQVLEPKIVSNQIGVNPLYTLMSMYVGFKIYGIPGLIIGPVIFVIVVSVLGNLSAD